MHSEDMYRDKPAEYFAGARMDVVDLVPSCDALLDVGCGTGATARWLRDHGRCKTAFGIEYFEDAAMQAKGRLDGVFHGDICGSELPYEDHMFDVVMCLDVLEHLSDPWEALRVVRRLLKPNGCLIVSVPNLAYWPVVWRILTNRFGYDVSGVLDRTHLRFFTEQTIKDVLWNSGFMVGAVFENAAEDWKSCVLRAARLRNLQRLAVVQYKIVATPK